MVARERGVSGKVERRRYSLLNVSCIVASSLCLMMIGGSIPASPAPRCRAVRQVSVTWPAIFSGERSRRTFVKNTIQDALREAVQEGVGLEVSDFTSMQSQTTTKSYMQKVNEIAYDRLQGFVLSYRILGRKWGNDAGDRRKFTVKLTARVCVPFPGSLPEVLAIQTFKWQSGQPAVEATQLASASLPKSRRIILSSRPAGHGYSDVVITGRIFGPRIHRHDRSAEVSALAHYLGQGAVAGISKATDRIGITLSLKARFTADQTALSEAVTETRSLPPDGSQSAIARQLVAKAVRVAMPALTDKIIRHERNF